VARAFRVAATDFYYQSIRLVPANVAWGAGFIVVLAIAAWLSPILALLAAPLLCLPFVGIVGMAAQIVRGKDVVLSDMPTAMRAHAVPALAAGGVLVAATVVFAANIGAGIGVGGLVGLGFATLAAWGLAASWILALAFWPLLVDPARATVPVTRRTRLAALVVLAEPLRFAVSAAALALVVLVSTVAFAALVSVSVAFIALVAARVVLPAADEFEARVAGDAATGPA
jgi:hypothetical protein